MTIALRPLRLGELLDRAVRLYRRNFLQLVGIVALVQVPITLAQVAISLTAFSGTITRIGEVLNNPAAAPEGPLELLGASYFVGLGLNALVTIAGFLLLQGVATAALTVAISSSYLGRPVPSILGAYRALRDRWTTVIGALLVAVALAVGVGVWWMVVPCVGWLTGSGMMIFLWYIILPLMMPVIILENGSATQAWHRAWMLARRRFWWVFGFALTLYIFNLLIVAGPAAVVGGAGQLLAGSPFDIDSGRFSLQIVVQSLTILITSVLYLPLQVSGMTLLYFDLRVRTEGADLVLATRDVSAAPLAVAAAPISSLTRQDSEPLLTGIDWRNFVVLSLGTVVLFVLLYAAFVILVVTLFAAIDSF